MNRLIPLSEIPYAARDVERKARLAFATRSDALAAARFRIVSAPGTHSRPYGDPPVIGWCCSEDAAVALSERMTRMPGGTCHAEFAYQLADVAEPR